VFQKSAYSELLAVQAVECPVDILASAERACSGTAECGHADHACTDGCPSRRLGTSDCTQTCARGLTTAVAASVAGGARDLQARRCSASCTTATGKRPELQVHELSQNPIGSGAIAARSLHGGAIESHSLRCLSPPDVR
jgi:hypothetical protein